MYSTYLINVKKTIIIQFFDLEFSKNVNGKADQQNFSFLQTIYLDGIVSRGHFMNSLRHNMTFQNVQNPTKLLLGSWESFGNSPHAYFVLHQTPLSRTNTSASTWTIIAQEKCLTKCSSTSGWVVAVAFFNGFRIPNTWVSHFLILMLPLGAIQIWRTHLIAP